MAVPRPAERALSRLLLRVLALLLTAGVAVAGIGAYAERSDRQDAAAAREFAQQLRPVAEVVFDHVQPLLEAERQVEDDANGGFAVYADVARSPAAVPALQDQQRRLAELRAPRSLVRVEARLEAGLRQLVEAAALYAALPVEQTEEVGVDLQGARQDALGRLRAGVAAWSPAVDALHPQDPPATPRDGTAPLRRPVSQGAYLLGAGRACGRADATGEGQQEEPTDAASARRTAAAEAVVVRELVRALLAVPAPPADRVRLEREVRAPLRAYGQVATVLDRLAAGRGDADRLFAELVAADADAARAALGLGDYGSQTCALFLGS